MKEIIRFIKFVFFSISAGLIEILLFTVLNKFTSFPYWPCYLIALIASVVWNFTLNRSFTFKSSSNIPKSMFKVFCYYLIFTPVTTILGNYLAERLLINEYIVTALNMILNFITEFIYQRYYVFKNTLDTK